MNDFVRRQEQDGVAVLTLSAPERRNALASEQDLRSIEEAVRWLDRDSRAGVAILTGEGSAFCAGGDLRELAARAGSAAGSSLDERLYYRRGIQSAMRSLFELELPLIAAVNGPAVGMGLDLMCLCDIRIASETAKFAESFIRVGLAPGDGGAWLLQRAIGFARAAELTFTGESISAAKALEWGLVSRVVAPEQLMSEAHQIARSIAAQPRETLRIVKRLMREAQQQSFAGALELAAASQALVQSGQDHRGRVAKMVENMEQRGPRR